MQYKRVLLSMDQLQLPWKVLIDKSMLDLKRRLHFNSISIVHAIKA